MQIKLKPAKQSLIQLKKERKIIKLPTKSANSINWDFMNTSMSATKQIKVKIIPITERTADVDPRTIAPVLRSMHHKNILTFGNWAITRKSKYKNRY